MSPAATWTLVNPLPRTLAHYQQALRAQVGGPLERAASIHADIEIGSRRGSGKILAGGAAVGRLVLAGLRSRRLLVLWPSLGLADLALWRATSFGRRRLVVVHDPIPLRRQYGFGRMGRLLGRWGSRGRGVEVVVHTHLAREALSDLSILAEHVLPHPMSSPAVRAELSGPVVVRVLGQYKSARDTDLLEKLAQDAPQDWRLEIAGRGWPAVAGWEVDDRFLTERELSEALVTSHVVLVPYRHYFQSGIAAQAFELGVPVVARRHEFLEALYGSDWPGLVSAHDAAAWIQAILSASRTRVEVAPARFEAGGQAWREALRGRSQQGPPW